VPEVLDDLARMLVADPYKFVIEVAALPLDDHRRGFPTEIIS
jgi:hypothetical protein